MAEVSKFSGRSWAMTKQEFWKMLGYVFENYDIPCVDCPACGNKVCATSCEQALKNVYDRLESEE